MGYVRITSNLELHKDNFKHKMDNLTSLAEAAFEE